MTRSPLTIASSKFISVDNQMKPEAFFTYSDLMMYRTSPSSTQLNLFMSIVSGNLSNMSRYAFLESRSAPVIWRRYRFDISTIGSYASRSSMFSSLSAWRLSMWQSHKRSARVPTNFGLMIVTAWADSKILTVFGLSPRGRRVDTSRKTRLVTLLCRYERLSRSFGKATQGLSTKPASFRLIHSLGITALLKSVRLYRITPLNEIVK